MIRLKEPCLVCLVILLCIVSLVELSLLLHSPAGKENPCNEVTGVAWVRDTDNCSIYNLCVAGQALPMPPCPEGHVWSTIGLRCINTDSELNDCLSAHAEETQRLSQEEPVVKNDHENEEKGRTKGVSNNKSAKGQAETNKNSNKRRRKVAAFIPRKTSRVPRIDVGLVGEFFPGHPCASVTTETVLPHPRACHRYYNCSLSPWDSQWAVLEPLTSECPYPDLFSTSTRSCQPYTEVSCGDRPEYKEPCDYLQNSCTKSDCHSCEASYASCLGLRDGVYPFPSLEWTPRFIVCRDERTVKQAVCEEGKPIFSPLTRSCVSAREIPKELGGMLPSCQGRPDGYHLDETGICHKFFHCLDQNYLDSASCPEGLIFDPVTLTCSKSAIVPPCGVTSLTDLPKEFCIGRSDGFHADLYGRCSLYYECKNQRLRAFLKCPYGSFNPRTKMCDTAPDLPAPCGLQTNPCMSRSDGLYPDMGTKCVNVIVCHNGYVSSIDHCPDGHVFDEISQKCQLPEHTPPPCGIAPSCKGQADGKHAAVFKGCQHYFTCLKGSFTGYGHCDLDQGGFFFNPVTRSCDFPQNICPPCGNKQRCSQVWPSHFNP